MQINSSPSTHRLDSALHHMVQESRPKEQAQPLIKSQTFECAKSALAYIKEKYIAEELGQFAKQFEDKENRKPNDQDFPVELITMMPINPTRPTLAIVGGMGPLAGAQAMISALEKFGDEREIVLLQLCNVPDRTAALEANEKEKRISQQHQEVVSALKNGFLQVESALSNTTHDDPHLVVACNTAHKFAAKSFKKYIEERDASKGRALKFDSMIDCVTAELVASQKGKDASIVILGTDGTLRTKLYIDPLQKKELKYAVPSTEGQALLMKAIYDGVKAFDHAKTLKYGEALMKDLQLNKQISPEKPFVILAACTEVPEIIGLLKREGSQEVKDLLRHAEVADPMQITLSHVARSDSAFGNFQPV